MRTVIALLATASLMGCATQAKFNSNMDSWLGASESRLVGAFGPPSNVYVINASEKAVTFASSGQVVTPGPIFSNVVGNPPNLYGQSNGYSIVSQQGAPTVIGLSCVVTFIVHNDMVTSWSARGNNCVSQ